MCAKLEEDEFKERSDAGESLESLGSDLNKAIIKEESPIKSVNVDFPEQMVAQLDQYSASIGIPWQALVKMWIFERLKEEAAKPAFEREHRFEKALEESKEKVSKWVLRSEESEPESKKRR